MVIRISEDLFRGRYDEMSTVYRAIKFDRDHMLSAFVGLLFLGAVKFLVHMLRYTIERHLGSRNCPS